jgi:pimeloyl-ACP methyl ester carboxylesterase
MPEPEFAELGWDERRVAIEYERIPGPPRSPLVVFLHEGLGSRSMWRDFPRRLCEDSECRGLVYSRPGYGQSTGPTERKRGTDYLHRQALEVLPRLLDALNVDEPVWLFGHSDGASIALIFAAHYANRCAGIVAVAPHIFVEGETVRGVTAAREAWAASELPERLARHHADPEGVFGSWNDIWLSSAFRGWTIEHEIESISCPVLAVQGAQDEYATMKQIHGIARRVPQAERVELADCGHSPHRDQPERLIAETVRFMAAR